MSRINSYNRSYYEPTKGEVKKILLLYSGSITTTYILKKLQEVYKKAEITTLFVDFGHGALDEKQLASWATKLGSAKTLFVDAREQFANEYITHAIKANATYQENYHLSTALSRPLLAKLAISVAQREGIEAIAHGASATGNDQVRLESLMLTLNPDIKIIAPARLWGLTKKDIVSYLETHKLLSYTLPSVYRSDENIWGRAFEGEEIVNPSQNSKAADVVAFHTTEQKVSPDAQTITLEFSKGIPVKINGEEKNLVDIIIALRDLGTRYHVGIISNIEDLIVGLKTRTVYDEPAAAIVIKAHQALERFVSTRMENEFKSLTDQKWGYLCYDGLWLEPLMKNLNTYNDAVNEKVSGTVTITLEKDIITIDSLSTQNGYYGEPFANVSPLIFRPESVPGFTHLYSLPMKLSQNAKKTILLSIGKRTNKFKLLDTSRQIAKLDYRIYATYKTHKFLKKHGITSTLVYKTYQPHMRPNILDLLPAKRFDLIINIPINKKIKVYNEEDQNDKDYIYKISKKYSIPLLETVDDTKKFVTTLS